MLQVVVLAYGDDLMIFGDQEHISHLDDQMQHTFLIKCAGNLNDVGIKFLGRCLRRTDHCILTFEDPE